MITKLDAELIMELKVDCPERLEVGANDFGYLRAIMISGGTFTGEKLRGEVVPGGADWNMGYGGEDADTVTSARVFAKYLLKTDDGCYIAIENLGFKSRVKENSVVATVPHFHAPKGKYEWLNYGVYVASLESSTEGVRGVKIKVYKMM